VTFDANDVVVVPFPFTDRSATRRRPAVILSSATAFGIATGQHVGAMITSARHSRWPLDVPITELAPAGLDAVCLVRMKLFTLDERLILRRAGRLGGADATALGDSMRKLLMLETVL
jgi:mRNA interferase MazF